MVNTLTDEHLERILCPSGKLAFAELATGESSVLAAKMLQASITADSCLTSG